MKQILISILAAVAYLTPANAADLPNFLLIIADDSTWSDYGFAGHPDVKTPHLDALRNEGMYLDRMFSPATTCSPSRHALYSGLYGVRSGAYPNHTNHFEGTQTLFTYLKDVGYRVALQNKSHVGPRTSYPYEVIKDADDLTETKAFFKRDANQPWFLAYGSNDPHSPWNRGPTYDPDALTIPPYYHDNAKTREMLAKYYGEISKLDEQTGRLMALLDDVKQKKNTFVLFLSEQGSSLPYGGKWSVYDTGIRVSALARWPGKVTAGSSCQALISYVDVAPTLLEMAGIDPSKVDAGCPDADGKKGLDGQSFLSVLLGKHKDFRDHVFSQHTTVGINGYKQAYPMRAVRGERFKLIRNLAPDNTYNIHGIHQVEPLRSWQQDAQKDPSLAKRVQWLFKRPAEELYDLHYDRYETINLAEDPAYAEIKERLGKELDQWMRRQGDEGLATEMKAHERQPRYQKRKKKR